MVVYLRIIHPSFQTTYFSLAKWYQFLGRWTFRADILDMFISI
jgi:hypothetical protein